MDAANPRSGETEDSVDVPLHERRLVGRALACWDRSRGTRAFPSRADFDATIHAQLDGSTFLIAVGDGEDLDEVIQSDDALKQALRLDPIGRKPIDIMPSATEKGLSFCRTAAELKKPIADVGRFTNPDGEEIRYRSVLLPLSDDQENVNYLLGAFSFKSVN
ncbi:MAG: hypothetical protein ACTSQV_01085 [Alphaproteobacteria bacterium]